MNKNKLIKISIFSLICFCATLAAEDEVPSSIGVIEEAEQLKLDISTIKSDAYNKIVVDPNLSYEIKDKALKQLDKVEVTHETIQKLADEAGVSDHYKLKAMKKARKLIKREK